MTRRTRSKSNLVGSFRGAGGDKTSRNFSDKSKYGSGLYGHYKAFDAFSDFRHRSGSVRQHSGYADKWRARAAENFEDAANTNRSDHKIRSLRYGSEKLAHVRDHDRQAGEHHGLRSQARKRFREAVDEIRDRKTRVYRRNRRIKVKGYMNHLGKRVGAHWRAITGKSKR